jgi:predicted nucleic acid-binding protein
MAAPEQMRVLVDTPIWIDHFQRDDLALRELLLHDAVCVAPPVLGELIAGNLPQREHTIADLRLLPRLPDPSPDEVFDWIDLNRLGGKGLSWVDCLLLVVAEQNGVAIWTRDRVLDQTARRLKLAYAARG